MDDDGQAPKKSRSNLPPGVPGPGRPKGSLNTATRNLFARAYLEHKGFNPLDELVTWFQDEKHSDESRLTALRELADRFAPRLKAIEVTNTNSNPLSNVNIQIITSADPATAAPPGPVIDAVAYAMPAIEQAAAEPVLDLLDGERDELEIDLDLDRPDPGD